MTCDIVVDKGDNKKGDNKEKQKDQQKSVAALNLAILQTRREQEDVNRSRNQLDCMRRHNRGEVKRHKDQAVRIENNFG